MDVMKSQEKDKMGLFEWIGEAIGNAFSALAEFIGDAFEGIVTGIFAAMASIGSDTTKRIIEERGGSETDLSLFAGKLVNTELEGTWTETKRIIDDTLAVKGEIPPAEANTMLIKLYDLVRGALQKAAIDGFIIEAATLGQVDAGFRIMDTYNQCLALTELDKAISMTKYQAAWLNSYERYINSVYPNQLAASTDLVRFALREVWDETRRPELLRENAPPTYYDYMLQRGFARDKAADYWAAHWVLPSVGQLNEMLHRRVIEPDTWDRFVKYNDFDPEVRPWLKAISYNPYTRVDTRRMWDLRLLKEKELKENYLDLGYDEEHAERMTIWTKVYVLATELRARFSKGWITETDVRTGLIEAGMPVERVDDYIEKIVKADAAERVAKERDLTKTDITRSVKKGLLSKDEGIERLMDLGYDEDEASFIIDSTVTEAKSEEIEKDRELSKADIIRGVALGYFTEVQGIDMLMKLGYDQTEAQYIIDIRVPAKKPEKLVEERDLTKAEIVKGVKKQVITWEQGESMLMALGYDEYEAGFILAIHVEALTGSPETWSRMQEIVNKSRKAQHLTVKEIPLEIKDLEGNIKKLTQEHKEAIKAKKPRQEIMGIETHLEPLKRRHKHLVEEYMKGGK